MCFSLYEATIRMHELRAQRHVIEARDPGPARSQGIHVTGVWSDVEVWISEQQGCSIGLVKLKWKIELP